MDLGEEIAAMEPGTWGEWAGAIGSILAVIVALGIALHGNSSQKKTQREVAVRAVMVYTTPLLEDGAFKVWNGGALPIWDVRSYPIEERGDGPEESATLHGAIPAQDGKKIEMGAEAALHVEKPYRVTFRDLNNVVWTKWVGGKFKELKPRRGYSSWRRG